MDFDQWPTITNTLNNGVGIICFIASKKSNYNSNEKYVRTLDIYTRSIAFNWIYIDLRTGVWKYNRKFHSINYTDGIFFHLNFLFGYHRPKMKRDDGGKKTDLWKNKTRDIVQSVWLTYFILHFIRFQVRDTAREQVIALRWK